MYETRNIKARSHNHCFRGKAINPWIRVLFEKLTGHQLVKKFPTFYGIKRFMTVFTRLRYLSLSWGRSIQSRTPPHFLKPHFNITLPPTSGSFIWFLPAGLPTKTLCAPLLSLMRATCPAHLFILDLITRIILCKSNKYYIFWVCVCSLSYPACKAHVLYYTAICGLSVSTTLFHIISLMTRFSGKKKIVNKKSVFSPSLRLLSETFLILRRIQRDIIKNVYWSLCKVPVILVTL